MAIAHADLVDTYLADKPRCAVRGCIAVASLVIGAERLCSRHAVLVYRDPDALICACGCRDEHSRLGLCREHAGRLAPAGR